ncbi:MAG: hypothetical protein NWT12_01845 [Paracoccaceae bacterium]|jgi:hypothetical protein|nr:hypothetical protein [Paracoccaceae bacterium]
MKLSLGLGWLLSPLRYRRMRRIAAGGAFAMGVFSFVTFDLAPRDGHLTVTLTEEVQPGIALLTFANQTEHAITGLDALFAVYGYDGKLLSEDNFVPSGMTVEGGKAKDARLGTALFDADKAAFLYFCGTFDGSYLVDRLQEVWVLSRIPLAQDPGFAQFHYARDRAWLGGPDCVFPADLQSFAAQEGLDLEGMLDQYRKAGMLR